MGRNRESPQNGSYALHLRLILVAVFTLAFAVGCGKKGSTSAGDAVGLGGSSSSAAAVTGFFNNTALAGQDSALQSFYNFSESTTGNRTDSSGTSSTLSDPNNAVGSRDGRSGNAANFNGTTGYLSATDSTENSPTTGMTLSISFFMDGDTGSHQCIAVKTDAYDLCYIRTDATTGVIRARIFESDGDAISVSSSSGNYFQQWYNAVMIAEGGKLRLYLNGSEVGTAATYDNTIRDNSNSFVLGRDGNNSQYYFDGAIDSLSFYTNPSFTSDSAESDFASAMNTQFTNYTGLLLHMDGTNGSSTFTDSSQNGATVTRVDAAQISTAQSKFGGASGLFDGDGDYLDLTNAGVKLGSGSFTVEFWVRFSLTSGDQVLITTNTIGSADSWRLVWKGATSRFQWIYGASNTTVSYNDTLTTNTWYHLAVVRNSTTLRVYRDGTQLGSDATVSTDFTATRIYMGGGLTLGDLNGYMDELRISNGKARYTSSFTPATSAFGKDD